MGLARKSKDSPVQGGEYAASTVSALLGDFPTLVEFLVRQGWPDGVERKTGTLTLSAQDGVWKGCLTDRDGMLKSWVSAMTIQELLELIEAGLEADELAWRVDHWAKAQEAQKRGSSRKP